jgi:serine/threonine protein kinase
MVVPYDSVKLGNLVAVGGFAEIYKSDFRGETVAVKKFLSSKESETGGPAVGVSPEFADAFRELQHEAFLMAKLRHPNVVSLHALCVRPICMIMEWIPEGTLGEVLFGEKAVPLNWETRLKYAMDIATGLAYLHAQSIMHLDFRSPNLLIKSKSSSSPVCVKVADFGLSTNSSGSHKGLKAFNPYWSSPEVILRKTYDLSTDIYSLGIVLWELLQNGRPFEEHQSKFKGGPEIVFSNAIANDGLRPTFPAGTPESLKKLISDCWQASAELRPCAADVVRSLEEILREFHRNPNAWAAPFFLPAPASSSPK